MADDSMSDRAGVTTGGKPLVLSAALGLLHAASFAPWGNWWVQLLVLAAFCALTLSMILDRRPARVIAAAGWLFGFGWFLAGVGWLFVSMHTYGLMPAPLALLALALFAFYLALFPAAALWATTTLYGSRLLPPANLPGGRHSGRVSDAAASGNGRGTGAFDAGRGPAARRAVGFGLRPGALAAGFSLTFAAAVTLAELLRGNLLTGFPWLAIGYAQTDGPLGGYASLAGSYGVGFAACLAAALLACLAVCLKAGSRPAASLLATLLPLMALLVVGQGVKAIVWSQPAGAPIKVRLLQGNVPQQMKFDPVVARQTMQGYLELIAAEPADLIVLPETAWTVPWASTPPDIAERLQQFVASSGSAVALGLPLTTSARSGRTGAGMAASGQPVALTNSVILFDRNVFAGTSPAPRYDKQHLVPFGEFVPWGFRWFVDLMTIPLGDFGRGSPDQPPFAVGGQRIAFNICYEDVFGEELLPAVTRVDGATILANVSNIAWFGDSHALPQHLQIARMRTLETARPMIRATNTGVTAAIDFDGRVLAALPPYQLGALSVTVQGRSGLTPYSRTGNWPVTVISLLVLGAAALPAMPLGARRRKPAKIAG
ncbi:MAG TPA: apolipoprotein N-acyltransferase [Lautropia sp.]|nr:apolipoprotein N-acyltransferase [Lautropia sp.]